MAEAVQPKMSAAHVQDAAGDSNAGLLRSMTYTRTMYKQRQPKPEAAVQRAILDLLAAEHVFAIRLNTGAFRNAQGRPIFMHSGGAGVADIVAFPRGRVLWIEAKAPAGRQTPEQASFQQRVESGGYGYIVARSADDVLRWLSANLIA